MQFKQHPLRHHTRMNHPQSVSPRMLPIPPHAKTLLHPTYQNPSQSSKPNQTQAPTKPQPN
ncbi:hypothetical protein M501DRAFT_999713 [Patellaria atrata CBS 101060]|uniref:Uncharacterized protein n=1 Tax=Patellaria atrata CBS 101060 TaxID=1346257 RepID=A0A9P4VKX1_9PEZI|nr:hypothetical protein M501DRAFT_999713 [Patellaria atrata CBS 101060]